MLVRFHDEADAEAQAVHDVFADDSPEKGLAFETELRHVIETIQQFPESGHPVLRGTRRKLMHGYPYSVIYKIFPDYIHIFAIAHFKQEWGYWLKRLEED